MLILAFVSSMIFTQTGDGRTRGMANAYTAVADDHNALFFNPAGLGFLKDADFVLGIGGNATITKALPFGEERYPEVWQSWDGDGYEYVYWDDFMDSNVFFDPADYGFSYDPDDEQSYREAVEAYEEWHSYYNMYETMTNISDIALFPQLTYVTRYWGISSIYEISLEPRLTEYKAEKTEFAFDVYKDVGVMGGVGIRLGPLGIGANMKYYRRKTDTIIFSAEEGVDGLPEGFVGDIFFGSADGNEVASDASHMEIGAGLLFAAGSLNFGLYSDNLIGFVNESEGDGLSVDVALLDTMSLGVALTPFNRKTSDKKGFLNFILSGDLKNLGSSTERILAMGMETGLHFGEALMVDGRLGYSQPLPGDMGTMADSFDPRLGTYSVGFGGRFLLGTMNFVFQVPSDMIFDPPQGNLTDEEMASTFGTFVMDMSLTF